MNPDFQSAFDEAQRRVGGWMEGFVDSLPNLVAAILTLVLFWAAGRLLRRFLRLALRRASDHRGVVELFSQLAYVGLIAVGTFVALGILNLDRAVTTLLAGAGIIGLAIGFAFQDTAHNFISGILLTIRRPFRIGDIVQTNEHLGLVEHIQLRATELRTFQGQRVIIPNAKVFQQPMINFTAFGERRVELKVGVAYGTDLDEARRVAIEALERLPMRLPQRPVELFFERFGESSIDFDVFFWIPFTQWPEFLAARSEAIIAIQRAFAAAGIVIPYPVRTIEWNRGDGASAARDAGPRPGVV